MKFCSSTPLSIFLVLIVASYNLDNVASFFINDSCRGTICTAVPIKMGGPPSFSPKLTAVSETNEDEEKNDEYDDFFDDFDPSDFEEYNNQDSQSSYGDRYTRDIDADDSDVDLETVTELIAKRSEMKRTRQFDEADQIRDELLETHGILFRDKDRKWRTGCSESQNHSKWLYGDTLKPRGSFKSRDDFGPNGHDYALASDAGPNIASISEEKIHELLAKRLSCKFDRDYDGADELQAELLSAGVVIDGKAREWRADGQYFSNNFAPREYKMSPHNCDISNELHDIEKLLSERALARAERLFKRSDEIRDELLEKFDVRINDKMMLWSVGGEQNWGKKYLRYTMSDRSKVPDGVDDIEKLVQQRDTARVSRDFAKADVIRNQLLDKNIIVDDKKRIWYVGKAANAPRNDSKSKDTSPYSRRGGGELSEEELNEIEGLVNKRDGHKRKRQYKDADTIRSGLLKDYGVQLDDDNREWYIVSTEYCMAHDSAELDEETRSKVQQKIQDRNLARGEKDYEKADTIKKVLFKKYNIAIDDRTKEWSVISREN